MIKRVVIFLLAFFTSMSLSSAQGTTQESLKSRILSAGGKIGSIECDFVQTKKSVLLSEPAVSKGHMNYRKPCCIRWEYTSPFSYVFILDGDKASVEHDGARQSFDMNKNRPLKEMAQMIISSIEGSSVADESSFHADFLDDGTVISVLLKPVRKDVATMWTELILVYERESLHAKRFEMHEASGDVTVIEFTNCKYGTAR